MLTPAQQATIDRRSSVFLQHLQATKRQEIKSSQLHGFSAPSLLENNNVCGIVGFISNDAAEVASSYLMEGLTILQNRGYDSAGICTVARSEKGGKPELVISKYASLNTTSDAFVRLRTALPKHNGHNVGIAHTRWATHGGKTDVNAHPHTDRLGRIALVHNGVIENSHELKEMLKKKHNITFKSETDTEVIAQCIGLGLDEGKSLIDAVKSTLAMLEGTWGLVIVSVVQPDRIIVVRNGSPLLIGLSRGKTFIASEASAFSRHTKEFISLDNGEIAIITADGVAELLGSENGKQVKDRVQMTEEEKAELSPHPYPHWTIREIFEQPEAASRALNYGGRFNDDSHVKLGGLEVNKDWLMKIKHLIIAACGTSYYAASYGAKLLRLLKCFDTVQVIDAAELDSDDFPSSDCGLLVISQSGETGDVVRCLTLAEQLNIPRLSVVNKVGSLIARTTGCGVYINAGREMAVASTKAFTCQVIVLSLVTLFFAQNRHHNQYIQERKQLISSLHRAPTSLGMVISALRPKCHEIAKKLIKTQTMFILGKGLGESIAKEGALKIKEITYTHAEAYSSGALKHGPFALIEPGTPIILVILDDKYKALNITAGFEVKSRGAYVIGITDAREKAKEVCDDILEIPHNGLLTGLLGVVPMQLIAYELAVLKNIDPDKPRNLAKSVTVL